MRSACRGGATLTAGLALAIVSGACDESPTIDPLAALAVVDVVAEVVDAGTLRDQLDPLLYRTAALESIAHHEGIAVSVDGELLTLRHDGDGPAGITFGWLRHPRDREPLALLVLEVDGEVLVDGTVESPAHERDGLAPGLVLLDVDHAPVLTLVGDGPFRVVIAAAGADAESIAALLRRDREAALATRADDDRRDPVLATIAWSRDLVHRQTVFGHGDDHDHWQYLALRHGRFVAMCGPMAGLHRWMLETLGMPARIVQFHGHRHLDGTHPDDTHVAVEVWLADERRWILSDPTFACFWTHDGAEDDQPLDTAALWEAVHAGRAIVPIPSPDPELPLPGRSLDEYYLAYEDLFGSVDFSGAHLPGPLGGRRVRGTTLGPIERESTTD